MVREHHVSKRKQSRLETIKQNGGHPQLHIRKSVNKLQKKEVKLSASYQHAKGSNPLETYLKFNTKSFRKLITPKNFAGFLKTKSETGKDTNIGHEEYEIEYNKFQHHLINVIKNLYEIHSNKNQVLIAARVTKDLSRIAEHKCILNHRFSDVKHELKAALETNKVKFKTPLTEDTLIHGEVLLLYGKEGSKFLRQGIAAGEYIFLYSFYIPCQGNKSSVSDCSGMMKEYILHHNADKRSLIVLAYDQVWPQTNKKSAVGELRKAGVIVVG